MGDNEMFKCKICEKEFETKQQLIGHMAHHKRAENKEASNEVAPSRNTDRRERIPLGTPRRKLVADIPKGKVGRWVNDNWSKDPTRVQDALRGGYGFLMRDKTGKIGEQVEDGNQDVGSRISRVVGTNADGSPITAYLMAIDKELYDQDQAEKQIEVDKVDEQINRGQLEQQPGDKRYIPSAGINIEAKATP